MTTFSPARLRLARRRRRLTAVQLGERAGVTAVHISRLENTRNEPTPETVGALAAALEYPAAFFYGPELDEVDAGAASFRSLKAMTARERDAALAAASLANLLCDWVEREFSLPDPDLLHLGSELQPELAARRLRSRWGLGEQPIGSMIDLLEAKGVRVFSLSENTRVVDAFSFWRNDTPYVFLNTLKSAEHSRFDAAHELGHLVMHRHGGPQQRNAEVEANAFASAFLMPEADVRSRVLHISSLAQVRRAKARWGVSVSAMTYRLSKLRILSEWQARQLFIEINRLGFRTEEPDAMPHETSHVWRTVFQELWSRRLTKAAIAAELHMPVEELESIVFGLTARAASEDRPKERFLALACIETAADS
jgi:Zn-dependent peptidase ImmA (M78 family)